MLIDIPKLEIFTTGADSLHESQQFSLTDKKFIVFRLLYLPELTTVTIGERSFYNTKEFIIKGIELIMLPSC